MDQKNKKQLIFYVHGWGSSGNSKKAKILQKHFGNKNVFAPTLPINAELAIHLLEQNIELLVENYDITLVGSSLGGFYSRYLSQKYNIKAVLINPCLDPCDIIKQFLGENTSSDGSKYSLIPEQIELYRQFYAEKLDHPKNLLVLLQKGDILIDYKLAAEKLSEAHLDIEERGSHEYDGFERKLQDIDNFSKGNI